MNLVSSCASKIASNSFSECFRVEALQGFKDSRFRDIFGPDHYQAVIKKIGISGYFRLGSKSKSKLKSTELLALPGSRTFLEPFKKLRRHRNLR